VNPLDRNDKGIKPLLAAMFRSNTPQNHPRDIKPPARFRQPMALYAHQQARPKRKMLDPEEESLNVFLEKSIASEFEKPDAVGARPEDSKILNTIGENGISSRRMRVKTKTPDRHEKSKGVKNALIKLKKIEEAKGKNLLRLEQLIKVTNQKKMMNTHLRQEEIPRHTRSVSTQPAQRRHLQQTVQPVQEEKPKRPLLPKIPDQKWKESRERELKALKALQFKWREETYRHLMVSPANSGLSYIL
jgi:hypothetical protein